MPSQPRGGPLKPKSKHQPAHKKDLSTVSARSRLSALSPRQPVSPKLKAKHKQAQRAQPLFQRTRLSDPFPLPKQSQRHSGPPNLNSNNTQTHKPKRQSLPVQSTKPISGKSGARAPGGGKRKRVESAVESDSGIGTDSSCDEEEEEEGSGSDSDSDSGHSGSSSSSEDGAEGFRVASAVPELPDPAYAAKKLRQLKKGMTLRQQQESDGRENKLESVIARSKELFVNYLGKDIKDGMLTCIQEIEANAGNAVAAYVTDRDKLATKSETLQTNAERDIAKLSTLTLKLLSDREGLATDIRTARNELDEKLRIHGGKYAQARTAIQKQLKDSQVAKKGRG